MAFWAAAIPAVASLAGSFLKKSSSQDQSKILANLAAQLQANIAARQGEVANKSQNYVNNISALNSNYADTVQRSLADTIAQRAGLQQDYRNEMNQTVNPELYKSLIRSTQQAAYQNLPGQLQQVKEQLAATGGFARGAASRALRAPVLQTAQAVNANTMAIQQQQMKDEQAVKQQVAQKLFGLNDQFLQDTLGFDRRDAQLMLENLSGADLKQFDAILDEVNARYNAVSSLYTGQASDQRELARQRADESNDRLSSILNAGSSLLSSYLGKK